ncbi:MAG: cation-transporting P-type ATPase [Gammaproteobacteria bacterium]
MQTDDHNPAWHALSAGEALSALDSDRRAGLSAAEARTRLAQTGPNRLPEPPRRGPLLRFLGQFRNLLIYVLLGAAVTTLALGHLLDTAVILGVVLVNALIGFLQEGRAEQAVDAIRRLLSLRAVALRDGTRREIDADELVPGDIVFLQSGDKVPADLRLLEVRSLRIEESALTGESVAVEKQTATVAADAPVGDRSCLAFTGTLVTFGQGTGIVVATGGHTEIGRVQGMLAEVEQLTTPLLRKVAVFGRRLTVLILCVAAATFASGVLLHGYAPSAMFMAAVGLAVAAIPEGLPAIMTIALAIGMQRMARRHAIVRRLPAIEALGSVTVICSDKTGTLTRNEMTVQEILLADSNVQVSGSGYAPHGALLRDGSELDIGPEALLREVARGALLCNEARLHRVDEDWQVEGDPMEGALLALAMKAGLDPAFEHEACPRTDVIPFESEHAFMATLHHDHTGHGFIVVKGAPERVLAMCRRQRSGDGPSPLDADHWHALAERAASQGQRVLAIATRAVHGEQRTLRFDDVCDLDMLALFAIADPPREEAIDAVARCRAAGIAVKMITGDHLVTARAIGQRIGLDADVLALAGTDIAQMDDASLREAVAEVDVFARASPEHKLRLVEALQARGEIVAMTGDGVNDAPALKRADVGIAMGLRGTEAAKESAEIVLADDNFASISHAVEEGRAVFDNVRKAMLHVLPASGGQSAMILVPILLGMGTTAPITPVQILWVNMVCTVTLALALAFEPPEPNVMSRAPRVPDGPLLPGWLGWRVAMVSLLQLTGSLGLFLWLRDSGESLEYARTAAVNALVFGEAFYLLTCRHLSASALSRRGLTGNRKIYGSLATLVLLQAAFVYLPPLQRWFGTTALSADTWSAILLFGITVLLVVEVEKAWRRRQHNTG